MCDGNMCKLRGMTQEANTWTEGAPTIFRKNCATQDSNSETWLWYHVKLPTLTNYSKWTILWKVVGSPHAFQQFQLLSNTPSWISAKVAAWTTVLGCWVSTWPMNLSLRPIMNLSLRPITNLFPSISPPTKLSYNLIWYTSWSYLDLYYETEFFCLSKCFSLNFSRLTFTSNSSRTSSLNIGQSSHQQFDTDERHYSPYTELLLLPWILP